MLAPLDYKTIQTTIANLILSIYSKNDDPPRLEAMEEIIVSETKSLCAGGFDYMQGVLGANEDPEED